MTGLSGSSDTSVAAIVPEYNEPEESIERTLIGLLEQSRPPDRLVLVDDASPSPPALARTFEQRVDVIRTPASGGCGAARNHGARVTDATYLLMVDCDIVLERNWVERALAFMTEHEEAGAVSGAIVPKVGPWVLRKWQLQFIETKVHRLAPSGPTSVTWIVGHVFFVRRSAFDEVGGFDPRFWLHGEDVDFSDRLRAAGYELFHLPDLTAESHERVSIGHLARKCLRNAGWDLRARSLDRPHAAIRPWHPVAASLSVLATYTGHSGRNLLRRRFSLLWVDAAIAVWSLWLVWRASLGRAFSRVAKSATRPSASSGTG